MKTYRKSGAKGALLDEYEKAINELIEVIRDITPNELTTIVDPQTNDKNCLSVQTILTHVVSAGFNYVIAIQKFMGEHLEYKERQQLLSIQDYKQALGYMFDYNVKLFDDYPDLVMEEFDNSKKILVRWGQLYDVEQLFEHAIVHVLRHRRQIERFLLILRNKGQY